MSVLNKDKLPSLDGLRGLAIIFVLISHFWIDNAIIEKTQLGKIGVHVFFVISGFLITTLLLKERYFQGKINLYFFYLRRFFRILPLVYLFIIVLIILNKAFMLNISNNSFYVSSFFVKNYPITNRGEDWWSSHLWSLSVEEQFYLFFPFFISTLNIKLYKKLVLVLIPLITLAQFVIQNKEYVGILYTNRIIHILINGFSIVFNDGIKIILIGSYLACYYFEYPTANIFKINNLKYTKYFSLVLFIIALLFAIGTYNLFNVVYVSDVIFSFVIGYIIILNLEANNYFAVLLSNKYIVHIGIISFSLYIWQQLFTHKQPWENLFPFSDNKFLNLIALLFISNCSYYLYEKKFLKIRDKFKSL